MREQFRGVAFALIMGGALLTLVSALADPLALGVPHSGFGWKQMLGTAVGLLLLGIGIWWRRHLGSE